MTRSIVTHQCSYSCDKSLSALAWLIWLSSITRDGLDFSTCVAWCQETSGHSKIGLEPIKLFNKFAFGPPALQCAWHYYSTYLQTEPWQHSLIIYERLIQLRYMCHHYQCHKTTNFNQKKATYAVSFGQKQPFRYLEELDFFGKKYLYFIYL